MAHVGISESVHPLLASLPIFDFPELSEAHDILWRIIADRLIEEGIDAPLGLTHGVAGEGATWKSRRLLLSQIGAYPLATSLQDRFTLVGAPSYAAVGCEGPFLRSAIVVRASSTAQALLDLKGRRCALNAANSNTGMNLFRAEISFLAAGPAFFENVLVTGSHLASLESVAAGQADVAAIDAVTLALVGRHRPRLARAVRVLHWTMSAPGPPYVTRRRQAFRTVGFLRSALDWAFHSAELEDARAELLLDGFHGLSPAHYRAVLRLEHIAACAGYPELR